MPSTVDNPLQRRSRAAIHLLRTVRRTGARVALVVAGDYLVEDAELADSLSPLARWQATGAVCHPSARRPESPDARPVTVLLKNVAPTVRNAYLETLPITNWHSLLAITDCRTSCKRVRLSRSTGQAIEISHCTPDPRGWSA